MQKDSIFAVSTVFVGVSLGGDEVKNFGQKHLQSSVLQVS